MMIKSRVALAASLLAIASAASAEITITPTLTSDYDFRGISQTERDAAFQLGLTYTGETGAYMGLWGSSVDLPDEAELNAKSEIDVYAGYAGGDAEEGFGYDVGMIYYSYPNSGSLNFPEFYTGISRGPVSVKLWYSWDFNSSGDTAYYADANLALPVGEGFKLLFHAGHSGGQYWSADKPGRYGTYTDWSAGFSGDFKGWTATVKFTDGSDLKLQDTRNHLGRVVVSVSRTFNSSDE